MITIGIDPGLTGAIGVLRDGDYVAVFDMPTQLKTTGRKEVDAHELSKIIKSCVDPYEYNAAIIEEVSARPNQGVSGVFSFGDSFGVARSLLTASIPMVIRVTPRKWKGYFNLDSDKELSRALAIRLFPKAPLHLKKHDGRSEALLMARYLWDEHYK